jgi:hypothetical protein
MLCVSGFVESDRGGMEVGVVLDRSSTLAPLLAGSLRELLGEQGGGLTRGPLGLKQRLSP